MTVNSVPDMKNPYLTVKEYLLFFVFILHDKKHIFYKCFNFASNCILNCSMVALILFCEQEL